MHKAYPELTEQEVIRFRKLYTPGKREDCWLWQGGLLKGVPYFNLRGRKAYAHLIQFRLHWGYDPSQNVSRLCHTNECINPHHLFERSDSAVQLDSIQRGTARVANQRGSNHHKTHLTEEQVSEIRRFVENMQSGLVKPRLTYREIAEVYGVKTGVITEIVYRKTWQHVN